MYIRCNILYRMQLISKISVRFTERVQRIILATAHAWFYLIKFRNYTIL